MTSFWSAIVGAATAVLARALFDHVLRAKMRAKAVLEREKQELQSRDWRVRKRIQ